MPDLLWLLLPVAAASGWYIARCEYRRRTSGASSENISQEYIKGFNYLLNEQPDKAVDTFLRVVDLNRDTLELHLSLGSLFRKRGEVDRAIRIHQSLLEEKGIPESLYRYTLLELAKDYMSAGLLDRAESLCLELIDSQHDNNEALFLLYEIYQCEKEWFRAIEIARRLAAIDSDPRYSQEIAHFYCELADHALQQQEQANASRFLERGLQEDPACGRVLIQQAAIAELNRDWSSAVESYQRLAKVSPALLGEVIPKMQACYQQLNAPDKMLAFLSGLLPQHQNTDLLLARTSLIATQQSTEEARMFLSHQLKTIPSLKGIKALAQLRDVNALADDSHELIASALDQLIKDKPLYHCENCGLTGRTLHWHCPSCKRWGSIQSIREFRWGACI